MSLRSGISSSRGLRAAVVGVIGAALLTACTASATPSLTSQPGGAVRIDVTLVDALRIDPASIAVPAGTPVTFVIRNVGRLEHEFFVGDEAAQAAHEQAMAGSGMVHDEPNGIGLKPGQTRELTMTFPAAGTTLAGCHVPGHYPAGMKATIVVQ